MVEQGSKYTPKELFKETVKWGGLIAGILGLLSSPINLTAAAIGFGVALVASVSEKKQD